jgi:diguanylate cyclase (GGDEF)-like protein
VRSDGLDPGIIDAALAALLDQHDEATVSAFGPDGLTVDMPGSVPLAGHAVVRARSALNIVVAADRPAVIAAWERARAVGASRVPIRLATDPEGPVVVHFLDARQRHGVYLGVFVAGGGADATMFDPATPAVPPRFARPGKSVLEAALEALRARHQVLARLAEALPVGVLHLDTRRRVAYSNDRLHDILGTPRAPTVDEQMANVVERDRLAVDAAVAAVLRDGVDDDIDIDVAVRPPWTDEPETRRCTVRVRALTGVEGSVTGAVVSVSDVTDSVARRDGSQLRATFDVLTRSHNRASTMATLEAMVAATDDGCSPAVILVGLEYLRQLNDGPGRAAGDEFLGVVARRLQNTVRQDDLVGRFGGGEFLVVCPGIATAAEAVRTATRISESLAHEIQLKEIRLRSQAGIGVAWSSQAGVDAEALVAQAHIAMYESKRRGAGRPVLFTPALPDSPTPPN